MTNEEFLKFVGTEFKIARMRKRITLEELAKLTGLSEAACGNVERGKHDGRILTYKRIAEALGVSMKDFV